MSVPQPPPPAAPADSLGRWLGWLILLLSLLLAGSTQVKAQTQPGNALNFGPAASVASSTDLPNYGGTFAVEAWVRTTSSLPNGIVVAVSCRDNFYLGIDNYAGDGHQGQALFNVSGTFLFGQSRIDDGRWHHVAGTKIGSLTTLYVDGVAENSTRTGNFYYSGLGLTVGAYSSSGSSSWPGSIDEVRIWSIARSAADIKAGFNNAPATPQAGLDVYYNFNRGTAGGNNAGINTLPNLGGLAGYAGTLNGFTLSGSTSNWVESYALVQPTNLAATAGSTSLNVTWTAPPVGTVTNYVLDCSPVSNFASGVVTLTPAGSATSAVVTGLSPNTRYYVRLRADKTSVTGQGANSRDVAVVGTTSGMTAPGNALAFDGQNDYATVNCQLNTPELTLEAWVNPTVLSGTSALFASTDFPTQAMQCQLSGNNLMFSVSGNDPVDVVSTTALPTGRWSHVAVVYSASAQTVKFYVNGVLDYTGTYVSALPIVSPSVGLGSWTNNTVPQRFYNGKLDEVRIYSTALTPAQVQADMLSTSPALPASLVVYYDFDEGVASGNNTGIFSLFDRSGNFYYGLMNNFAKTSGNSTSNWVESYALVVPTLGAANPVNPTDVTLNWTAPTIGTLTSYALDVSSSSTFASGVTSYTPTAGATSQVVPSLLSNRTYYYRLRADKTSVTGQGAYATGVVRTAPAMAPPGNALAFDGNGDYVTVSPAPALNSLGAANFTLEAWVYYDGATGTQSIIRKNGDYNFYISGNILHAEVWSGSNSRRLYDGQTVLPAGRWAHVAAVWNKADGTCRLYVNGQADNSGLYVSSTISNGTEAFTLGLSPLTGSPLNGRLDEVRVYNVGLSAAQLQADMVSASPVLPASLLLHFNFDQGAAGGNNTNVTTLSDQSNNRYDGTMTGFSLTSGNTTSNFVESYALAVPTITAATGSSGTGFTANWTAPANGTVDNGYRVDVATSHTFAPASLLTPAAGLFTTSTSQAVTGLSPDQTYYYRVRADKTSVTGQGSFGFVRVQRPVVPPTPPGNALAFDGTNDYVAGSNEALPQGRAPRTVAAWVRTTWTSSQIIFNYGTLNTNMRMFLRLTNGQLECGTDITALRGNQIIIDNRWHHVAATYDGTTLALYVDGVLDAQSTSTDLVTSGFGFRLGNSLAFNPISYNDQLFGRLDEVRVYNTVLTPAQLQADMTSATAVLPANLVLAYNFDHGQAGGVNTGYTSVADQSANQTHGQLVNFALNSSTITSNFVESYAQLVPTGLAVSARSGTGFTATWTAPTISGATAASDKVEGYVLDVSTSPIFASGVSSYPVAGIGTTSQVVTGLTNGTDYYLRVRAEKASVTGQGLYSATVATHTIGTDARLTSLVASVGLFSPIFTPATLNYLLYLPAGTSTYTLTPTASNGYTSIVLNGAAIGSGVASTTLSVGSTATLVLTSEDGRTTTTYTVQAVPAPGYFRSAVATGYWTDASSWEASNDGSTAWTAAPVVPTGSYVGTVTVRTGHTITVGSATSTRTTIIESGAVLNTLAGQTLTVPGGATMTINAGGVLSIGRLNGPDAVTGTSLNYGTLSLAGTLTVNGTLVLNTNTTAPAAQGISATTTTVGNGGRVVQFASAASTTMPVATWSPGATLELAGGVLNQAYTAANQTLQNLDVNLSTLPGGTLTVAQPYLFNAAATTTVAGTLTVRSTGSGTLRLFNAPSGTLTLGSVDGSGTRSGGYVQQAGNVVGSFGGNTVTTGTPLNVLGSFQLNGGTFAAALASSASLTALRTVPLTVAGDFSVGSGATFNLLSSAQGPGLAYTGGTVALNGDVSNAGTLSTGNTASTTQKLQFGKTGVQTFSNTGSITGKVNGQVNSGSVLDMGTSSFGGTGTFTTASGAVLRLGSPDGISASGAATGNVQATGTRSFAAGTSFEFNGTAAQVTGAGFPAAALATASTLTFNNPAGVTLSQALTVPGTLSLKQGLVTTTAANLLTLGSSAAVRGTLDAAATNTGRVAGPLKCWVAAAIGTTSFPLGLSTTARPASISYTTAPTAGGSLTAEFVASPAGSQGLPLAENGTTVNTGSDDGYWRFTAADGLTSGTYTATFTFTDITGVTDYSRLLLLKRPDAASDWALVGTGVATTGSNTVPVLSRSGLSGFSDFTAGLGSATPLPVVLSSFTAQAEGPDALLRWTTAQEKNNAYFAVESSVDGRRFTEIGRRTGQGTSTSRHDYQLADANLARYGAPRVYYRLRQVDQDGTSTLSEVRAVSVGPLNTTLALYPNPARHTTQLTGATAGAEVQLLDPTGRLLTASRADAAGTATLQLPAHLPAGVYLVRSGRHSLRLLVE